MHGIIENDNKLIVRMEEKYIRNVIITNPMDDFFIGAIAYLNNNGKSCEFLGFNAFNGHVVLIDSIKYCTNGVETFGDWGSPHKIEFFIVEDLDHDYKENRFKDRAKEILDKLVSRII